MPGIVLFNRRWSLGSDDIIIPALFLLAAHCLQSGILTSTLILLYSVTNTNNTAALEILSTFDTVKVPVYVQYNSTAVNLGPETSWIPLNRTVSNWISSQTCGFSLQIYSGIYLSLLVVCLMNDIAAAVVSCRGGILQVQRRAPLEYLVYIRLVLFLIEILWLVVGIIRIFRVKFVRDCPGEQYGNITTAVVSINLALTLSGLLSIWCVFDSAGRSWVKMRRYQASVRQSRTTANGDSQRRRRTGSSRRRTLRHRRALLQYERIWDRRFRHLFCCVTDDRSAQNTFTDVAKLVSEFFRDLDVVPSDIIAGLLLLRRYQTERMRLTLSERSQHVLSFMSGRPIYSTTSFLNLSEPSDRNQFDRMVHYMKFALAAYSCPMLAYTSNCCCLLCKLSSTRSGNFADSSLTDQGTSGCCCFAPTAGIQALLHEHDLYDSDFDITYAYKTVEVESTPFFVAVDHRFGTVVVSIRGTLSLHDVLTDLRADCEVIPTTPLKEDWFGHKGIVRSAVNIRDRLIKDRVIEFALSLPGCENYSILLTGHSLGAGAAAVLGLLLRPSFGSKLSVLSYSPPGGLLSLPAAVHSRQFVTSVIIGKDVIPRIGLPQLEVLRADLIRVIMHSQLPKWSIIASSLCCCGNSSSSTSSTTGTDSNFSFYNLSRPPHRSPLPNQKYIGIASSGKETVPLVSCQSDMMTGSCSDCVRGADQVRRAEHLERSRVSQVPLSFHPTDPELQLSTHNPLYLPGNILHVVRSKGQRQGCFGTAKAVPIFHAIWADYSDFDEVLISPSMIQDHMPDYVLESLHRVIEDYEKAESASNQHFKTMSSTTVRSNIRSAAQQAATLETISERPSKKSYSSLNPKNGFSNENSPNPGWSNRREVLDEDAVVFDAPINADTPCDSTRSSVLYDHIPFLDSDMETSTDMDSPIWHLMTAAGDHQRRKHFLHHSHTMPPELEAPIATPETWSMCSSIESCVNVTSPALPTHHHYHQQQSTSSLGRRPVSDYCNYCYYVFPDEEISKKPFDNILPKPSKLYLSNNNNTTASLDRRLLPSSARLVEPLPKLSNTFGSGTLTPSSPNQSNSDDFVDDSVMTEEETPRPGRQNFKKLVSLDSDDSLVDKLNLSNHSSTASDRCFALDSDASDMSTGTVLAANFADHNQSVPCVECTCQPTNHINGYDSTQCTCTNRSAIRAPSTNHHKVFIRL